MLPSPQPRAEARLVQCAPPIVHDERRLAVLRALALLDSAADPTFDAMTRLAVTVTGCPIGAIGLVDARRTWFMAAVGLPQGGESDNALSFCARAIASPGLFEVPDAHADPAFAANPLVTGPPHVRFYAGVPLVCDGQAVGTLCVVDHRPYRLRPDQRAAMDDLAQVAMQSLRTRLRLVGATAG
ncbi:MAG: GAF domain-containing protein [Aquabacterium sp.]